MRYEARLRLSARLFLAVVVVFAVLVPPAIAFSSPFPHAALVHRGAGSIAALKRFSTAAVDTAPTGTKEESEDRVVTIAPGAMGHLIEMRKKLDIGDRPLYIRMGVRSGGCSGMSYVMDLCEPEEMTEDVSRGSSDEHLKLFPKALRWCIGHQGHCLCGVTCGEGYGDARLALRYPRRVLTATSSLLFHRPFRCHCGRPLVSL